MGAPAGRRGGVGLGGAHAAGVEGGAEILEELVVFARVGGRLFVEEPLDLSLQPAPSRAGPRSPAPSRSGPGSPERAGTAAGGRPAPAGPSAPSPPSPEWGSIRRSSRS